MLEIFAGRQSVTTAWHLPQIGLNKNPVYWLLD
jgi:hypothetical protein